MKAVSGILQRSERQDLEKLTRTFVDVGILPQLSNKNHQVFYGRRGTGKTHILKVLESNLRQQEQNTVIYVDSRILGSTSQFSDPSIPLRHRCLALFRDVLAEIYNGLLAQIVDHPASDPNLALEAADTLAATITMPSKTYVESVATQAVTGSKSTNTSASIDASSSEGLGAQIGHEEKASTTTQTTKSYSVETQDKVIFPSLHAELTEVLKRADTDLYVLIDEWSSLPIDIQPFLAEFLKRGILPVKRAVVKIASLEYRSAFRSSDGVTGFELGADIATALELDDYYVFDRNPESVTDVFSDMLVTFRRKIARAKVAFVGLGCNVDKPSVNG
jgi:hypothetical protein